MTTRAVPEERMLSAVLKPFVARGLMVCLIAAGSWALVARPAEASLASRRRALASMRGELSKGQKEAGAALAGEESLAALSARGEAMNEWSGRVGDDTQLFERLGELARARDVKIDRLDPRAAVAPSKEAKFKDSATQVSARACSMDVSGSYESIARFLEDIDTALGASKVTMFRLSPGVKGGGVARAGMVSATVETAHLRVRTPIPAPMASGASAGVGARVKETGP